jgi:cytochrome oxidase assembly protein ShyY1
MVITSILLFALALWQVQRRGGFGWLMGKRKNIAAMERAKGEYIDLQSQGR